MYLPEFAWNRASPPKIFALTWNGLTVVDLEENNKCNEVRIDWNKFGETGLKAVSAFAIADKLFVFVTSSEMIIYGRNRETYIPIPITNPPLRQILAVSQSSQPFPGIFHSYFPQLSHRPIVFYSPILFWYSVLSDKWRQNWSTFGCTEADTAFNVCRSFVPTNSLRSVLHSKERRKGQAHQKFYWKDSRRKWYSGQGDRLWGEVQ